MASCLRRRPCHIARSARTTRIASLYHKDDIHNVDTPQYCSGDKIEKNEIGGTCSAYGEEERRVEGFGVET